MKLALLLAIATLTAGAAHAVDVYKWKDAKGVVHYGDRPASGASSSMLQVPGSNLSDEEEEEAQGRLDAARAKIVEPSDDDSSWRYRSSRVQPAQGSTCADAWRRYHAAESCFSAHRAAGSKGVNGYGQFACEQVSQPTCSR